MGLLRYLQPPRRRLQPLRRLVARGALRRERLLLLFQTNTKPAAPTATMPTINKSREASPPPVPGSGWWPASATDVPARAYNKAPKPTTSSDFSLSGLSRSTNMNSADSRSSGMDFSFISIPLAKPSPHYNPSGVWHKPEGAGVGLGIGTFVAVATTGVLVGYGVAVGSTGV